MILGHLLAVILYLSIIVAIAILSHRKKQTSADFIIGGRSMNFFVTALAAHASDMSSWIFMAYPAVIFSVGFYNIWAAVGLTLFMFLNWQIIAPKIRVATEEYNAMTFSSFFESRFADTSGYIRILTAVMLFIFYTIYISAGLIGLGLLIESLFQIPYIYGITIGVFIVIPYLFVGGYVTLAYTDLFQGLFLLLVITFVPLYILPQVGGTEALSQLKYTLLPTPGWSGVLSAFFIMVSWGLGYFGQPHIVTKFMGIDDVKNIYKAKYIGITWQIIALTFATLIGVIAILFFKNGISDPQLIFITMVEHYFPSFIAALILCAILGVTITSMDSQILVLASSLAEDFYKRIFRKTASSKEILWVSRLSIILIATIAYLIALRKNESIFELVSYAWFGLGSSFGPLMLFSLYVKSTTKEGAWAGVIVGGSIAAIWPLFNTNIPTLIPGFGLACIAIWLVSLITKPKAIA